MRRLKKLYIYFIIYFLICLSCSRINIIPKYLPVSNMSYVFDNSLQSAGLIIDCFHDFHDPNYAFSLLLLPVGIITLPGSIILDVLLFSPRLYLYITNISPISKILISIEDNDIIKLKSMKLDDNLKNKPFLTEYGFKSRISNSRSFSQYSKGITISHVASALGNQEIIKYLEENGYNFEKRSENGSSPISYSILFNNKDTYDQLVKKHKILHKNKEENLKEFDKYSFFKSQY